MDTLLFEKARAISFEINELEKKINRITEDRDSRRGNMYSKPFYIEQGNDVIVSISREEYLQIAKILAEKWRKEKEAKEKEFELL